MNKNDRLSRGEDMREMVMPVIAACERIFPYGWKCQLGTQPTLQLGKITMFYIITQLTKVYSMFQSVMLIVEGHAK